jgi:hypothetical protein
MRIGSVRIAKKETMMLVIVWHYIWLTLGKTTWISGSFDFVTTSKIQTFLITRLIL